MPSLGISTLFTDRAKAQLFIFRQMQAKIPGLKIYDGSIMGYQQEMGVPNKNQGMEGYLKIAEYKDSECVLEYHDLESDGVCIAFTRLDVWTDDWYFDLPHGNGPLEGSRSFQETFPNNWRRMAQEVFLRIESKYEEQVYKTVLKKELSYNPEFKRFFIVYGRPIALF